MQLPGKSKLNLRADAKDFINLYTLLGERAENFLPNHVFEKLAVFVRLCHEQPYDLTKLYAEIDKQIIELKEAIPGYTDVALMLAPHDDSKAFQYRTHKLEFVEKLTSLIDTESVDEATKIQAENILNSHDFSVGTPPVTNSLITHLFKFIIGDQVSELKKFSEVIGIKGDQEKTQWNYFLDVLDQMVIQSSHYTTPAEKRDFLEKIDSTVNFKGLNGFITGVVGGNANTAVRLLSEEVFRPHNVKVIDFQTTEQLYADIKHDFTSIFIVKIQALRQNFLGEKRWFPYLTRLVFVDNSTMSQATNTSLVFCFHNGIINILNKVHTKKLGELANTQLNLRLIVEKINLSLLSKIAELIQAKIADYELELNYFKTEQLGETDNIEKNIVLFKFDDFAKQIIKDKFTLVKLLNYVNLVLKVMNPEKLRALNVELIQEFETRTKSYFYGNNAHLQIATIVEGGGRNQIKTYGDYLLRRKLKPIDTAILKKCRTILDIIPNNYKRTLDNHFHKNFGINLFLEKYKQHLTKRENEADNKGRFSNFLIDLGIKDDYDQKSTEDKNIIKAFVADLGNLEKTSISDDVQMIIRDILFHREGNLRPYILYNSDLAWEYQDLFPPDRFDINPFDLEIGMNEDGRIDFERLTLRLSRMKRTFALFDDSANLWDRFCENLTIVINDPSNPSGFTDFNNEQFVNFLRFTSMTKITLFLDEAYNDSVPNLNKEEPKWRTISRYVFNNIDTFPNISIVSSISTTKNLSGTGNRLGAIVASPMRRDVTDFAKKGNTGEFANTNSVYFLANVLETAQVTKRFKDRLEEQLPQNSSIRNIKKIIEANIKSEITAHVQSQNSKSKTKDLQRLEIFEGSPLHLFLLDELIALDKLEVLNLPDDFMYKGAPFFKYYQEQLLKNLNGFRINKVFLRDSALRLNLAKHVANEVITKNNYETLANIADSDGSYLFNLQLKEFGSYQGLEKFSKKLAEQRGVAVIPYKNGFVRFAVGAYLDGNDSSYTEFGEEFRNALEIFFNYWKLYFEARNNQENKHKRSEDLLDEIFAVSSDKAYIAKILEDFYSIKNIKKAKLESLKISNEITLYQAYPADSGIVVSGIPDSKNSVFEFSESIGNCRDVTEFIRSKAFTKLFENLLPQIYKKIPALKKSDYKTVLSKFGKPTLLKFIENKYANQPNNYVLDDYDEFNIMKEILIEMEKLLFSDSKFKILALKASDDVNFDQQRLEGVNQILRKYLKELLLNFNLPFEHHGYEPTVSELFDIALEKFTDLTGLSAAEFGLKSYTESLVRAVREASENSQLLLKINGLVLQFLFENIVNSEKEISQKLRALYLLQKNKRFQTRVLACVLNLEKKISEQEEFEHQSVIEKFVFEGFKSDLASEFEHFLSKSSHKITQAKLRSESREMAIFLTDFINRTKSTEYYDRYTHALMKFTEAEFARQKSSVNEMIQHGITVYQNFDNQGNALESYNNGSLHWISDLMKTCGVISAEQPVQMHTRIVTDAKKREYPFHKIDRTDREERLRIAGMEMVKQSKSDNDYIKNLASKPNSEFFAKRLEKFAQSVDYQDYRCKITDKGLVKELVIFHKTYIKYLADNFRLLDYEDVSLETIKNFVPDVLLILGAPEKVISFPQIGYFDLQGPNGKIKTLVTPLKKKSDYFGNVKKPRLTLLNEKIKDMGGIPVHGSMFAVEEEDGSIFVVQISGDSGVGKSEMLAALMLKWLKKDLNRIRSVKLIAGDMFHIFPDKDGNLYGIGTEVGDFSRVTDFDPDYVRYYRTLFENAADSNAEDLNSRSTISGLCDITMPYKIDIMLTAGNFAKQEAGVLRYDNPENFIYYRESHGERKEKATSQDHPHFQRTLLRYTSVPEIVSVLDTHGNYLDDVLDWEFDAKTGAHYLASSYKMIDKIDIEQIVNQIFTGRSFEEKSVRYEIKSVSFDIIKNRFSAIYFTENKELTAWIEKVMFDKIFNALASTPTGQPFISEEGQIESKAHLLNILRGKYGKGKGSKIQLGLLSTDLGKKGREISGPQKAAEELKKLIQEVRNENPDINRNKQKVRNIVSEKYNHIFDEYTVSPEILRYNFVLWQMQKMQKAEFVRIDDMDTTVDMSKLKGFTALPKDYEFSPLLVTPNINIELNSFSETYEQLMNLPNIAEYAQELGLDCPKLYIATGYSFDTVVNNLILQLLIMHGHLSIEDLNRSKVMEKTNRETIAAAKFSTIQFLQNLK